MKMSQTLLAPVRHPIMRGVLSHWGLGQAAGTTRFDSVGGHGLTDNNTVAQVAGKRGYGAGFTRTSSQYLSKDAAALRLTDWTLSAWVKLTAAATGYMALFARFGSGTDAWSLQTNNTDHKLAFKVWYDATSFARYTTEALPQATWINILARVDKAGVLGTANAIYLDVRWEDSGTQLATWGAGNTKTLAGAPLAGTAPLTIGALADASNAANAAVGPATYWNRPITAAEGLWVYGRGAGKDWPY